mgnify:CR=1 FL=1
MPGVGISIGLTRLFFQLREAGIIKPNTKTLSKALIIPMKGCMEAGVRTVNMIRSKNIPAQIYVENDKMGKKFGYADKLQIPYVVIIGESEVENNTYSLKNMITGDQEEVSFDELIEKIK